MSTAKPTPITNNPKIAKLLEEPDKIENPILKALVSRWFQQVKVLAQLENEGGNLEKQLSLHRDQAKTMFGQIAGIEDGMAIVIDSMSSEPGGPS